MDGGSSINILYAATLKRMRLSEAHLSHSNVNFHGIVPGRQASSMGRIALKVTFGGTDNFRTDDVSFEVVPFKSAYHAIFGRPAFAKFMARPCYIYSKLKMPGPNGIIAVQGDFKKAKECEAANAIHAQEEISREELEDLKKTMGPNEMPATEKPSSKVDPSFKPKDDTKKVKLTKDDPTKEAIIGAGLDEK